MICFILQDLMPRGQYVRSKELREYLSEKQKNRTISEETRLKISKAVKGKKRTPEQIEKMSQAAAGPKNLTEEQKKAWGERAIRVNKGRKHTPEARANMKASHAGWRGSEDDSGTTTEEYRRQRSLGYRWCTFKKHYVAEKDFSPRIGHKSICKECQPEFDWERNISFTYGINGTRYRDMLDAQNGACAICQSPEPGQRRRHFAIDHDHSSGRVRGLLCISCNLSMERLDTVKDWASKATAYLKLFGVE
jgi:Recombination endonuclease VII/NUMOD3 motif